MIPFQFETATSPADAAGRLAADGAIAIAGGTTVVDLMKLNVMTAERVVSVKPVLSSEVRVQRDAVEIGAGCTMSQCAETPGLAEAFPALRQSLLLAATPQIRNMATMAGNLLQRTRSPYFRHTDLPVEGPNAADDGLDAEADPSLLAVLGNDGRLVGTYPGDFGVVFAAFGGEVITTGSGGERTIAAGDLYREPAGIEHQYSTTLGDDVITSLRLPINPRTNRSLYFKVRERSSYAFALASAAVGLELDGQTIRSASIGLGGLGSVPWRSDEAVDVLTGAAATDDRFEKAADAALAAARPPAGAEFKVVVAKRTLVRALRQLRDEFPIGDERMWAQQHGRG